MKKLLLAVTLLLGYINFATATAMRYVPPATTPVGVTITGPTGTVNTSPITFTITTARPVSVIPNSAFTVTNGTLTTLTQKLTLAYSAQFGTTGTSGNTNTLFYNPNGIATNGNGVIYVADGGNNRIKVLDESGTQLGVIGSGGTGPSQFDTPFGVALDALGKMYVTDEGNNRVQVFDISGNYIGMFGSAGSGNGQFNSPRGIHISPVDGNIYVADAGNNRVQVFSSSTFAYIKTIGSAGNGPGQFYSPSGITTDAGNIYVTDSGNGRVEKFTALGTYTATIGSAGSLDGQFNTPAGIVADGTGKIYVVDNTLHRVQAFTTSGIFSGKLGGNNPGTGNTQFNFPTGIAADKNGKFYVVDQGNQRVSVLTGKSVYTALVQPTDNGDVILDLTAAKGFDNNGNGNAAATYTVNYFNAVPSAPAGLTATSLDGKVKLDWTANPVTDDILSYKIFWGTSPNPTTLLTQVSGAVTTYTTSNSPLTNGVTYYYRITAVNSISNESAYSNQVSAIPKADQTITAGTIADKTYNDLPFSIANLATASSGLTVEYSIIQGPAQLDAATHTILTLTGIGTVKIAIKQPGNNVYHEAPEVDVTFNVLQADPNFTVTSPLVLTYGTPLTADQFDVSANVIGDYTYTGLTTPGTIYNAGTDVAVIDVTFIPRDGNYATVTRHVAINVTKVNPIINWSLAASYPAKTDVSALPRATISPAISGSFTYNPVSGALHPGTGQTLKATFIPTPGSTDEQNYNSVYKILTFDVTPLTTTLTWNPTLSTITYGTPLSGDQLNAQVVGNISGPAIVYDPLIGTVLEPGDHLITAIFTPYDADYAPATQTATIHVDKIQPVITWNQPVAITYGTRLSATQLNATTTLTGGSFAYIPDIGTKLPAGNGQQLSLTYTPSVADQAHYATLTATQTIDVLQADPNFTVTNPIVITYNTPLTASMFNLNAAVGGTFTYNNGQQAPPNTIYNVGTMPAPTVLVTFTPTDGNYKTVSIPVTITVNKATPTITWNVGSTVAAGSAVASLAPVSVNPATIDGDWSYSPTIVHPGNNQQLTVTFTPKNGYENNYETAHKTVTVNVNQVIPQITWNVPPSVPVGTVIGSAALPPASVASGLDGDFTYSPALGTALNTTGSQQISVTFTPKNATAIDYSPNSKTVTINVTVTNPALVTPQIIWATPQTITYGAQLGTIQLPKAVIPGTGTQIDGTFQYSMPLNTVLNASSTPYLITASFTPSPANATLYNSTNATINVKVNQTVAPLNWNAPAPVPVGTILTLGVQLNASSTLTGSYIYTPAAGDVLNTVGNQTLSVVFTPDNTNTNYAPATKSVVINVYPAPDPAKITPVIVWNNPADINYGTPLSNVQENAVLTDPAIQGQFKYSFDTSDPVSSILSVGTHRLDVTFVPTDDTHYNHATERVYITVNAVGLTLTWAHPADINYGTALSGTQLNAKATAMVNGTLKNILGTYDYSHDINDVLNAGANQPLSVTFTPNDVNYGTAVNTSTTITVNKANPVINWSLAASYPAKTDASTLPGATISPSISGSFTYNPASGPLHAGTGQTIKATFIPTPGSHDEQNYNSVNKTLSFDVSPLIPTLTWNPAPSTITYGMPLVATQFNASADNSLTGQLTYNHAAGQVLTIADPTITAHFVPDDHDYQAIDKTITLTINKANPAVTLTNPVNITYGTPVTTAMINAHAAVPGTFTYDGQAEPASTIYTVGGANTISVKFVPADGSSYNELTVPVSVTVQKTDPAVTFNNPVNITYGQVVTAALINAQADVPGNFTYNGQAAPAATIYPVGGANSIIVAFHPTDAANYNGVSNPVTINVNKITPTVTLNNSVTIDYKTTVTATMINAHASVSGSFTYDGQAAPPATIYTAAGPNTITVVFHPTNSTNYSDVTNTVTINVNKIAPAVAWTSPATITYGTALGNAQLYATANVDGKFDYLPVAGTVLAAGSSQSLTVTFTPADPNYIAVPKQVTINVLKAPLIIKADNQSRGYGQPNPDFSLTYTGLVNNDTPASLASPAVVNCSATQASPAGTYTINVNGAASDNYNISYASGTLTVTTVGRDITFDKLPVKTYGDADFDGGATATTGEPVIYTSSNPAIATIVNGKIHIVGAGYVTITASLAPNPSYNTTPSVSQFMIVNKAIQNIDFASIPAQMRGTTYDLSGIKSSSGLPVTFTVNDEKVATINGLTLSSLRIGITGVIANQAGNENYYPAVAVLRDLKVEDPIRDVIVHPAVSPNADGINDFLYIEGIAQHPDNRITIINRNGVRVYEINGYNNTSKVFDGHSNFTGALQQAGTYFYLVEYVSDGVGRHQTGYFVLKY